MPPSVVVRHLAGVPGRPVLVVGPSLGTTADRLWGTVATALPGRYVLGWDLPGHGAGPAADRLTPGFSMAGLAAAVLEAVEEVVGDATPFAYAGDSVGGAVGLQLALDRPDRVTSLTVLCSAVAFGPPAGWHDRAALVRAEGMAPMLATSPARWFGSSIRAAADGRCDAAMADLAAVDPEGYARVCEALGGFDVRARLAAVRAPLLAVAGAEDVATPPAVLAEIADGVPDGRLAVLDGVGHLAPYEAPAEVAALLRDHLSAHSDRSTAASRTRSASRSASA
ncbi:alpha/beta fold hydrolase [Nocardioides carbamazepini]|uniref:alpha/beta fold hydrolase n=1 Tax=Nocardioides carbamazepini TaxID=2854259 RepID=UPI002149EE6E|nr:alpha/beta fold hydrolase [Nocardioides carbamazepini]MCR1784156.1 alpha/beta fold hydrolase [Nocardioides carbamazepini]